MGQPVFAIYKNESKERDYPGFAQACAVWAEDPTGKRVVKLNDKGQIVEEFKPEECEAEAKTFRDSHPEQSVVRPDGIKAGSS